MPSNFELLHAIAVDVGLEDDGHSGREVGDKRDLTRVDQAILYYIGYGAAC